MESVESQIVDCSRRLAAALRDFAYTRKDEDKKRIVELQQELLRLCPDNVA